MTETANSSAKATKRRTKKSERRKIAEKFSWLRPPKAGEDGSMSLLDHLRELRYRVIIMAIAVVITTSIALNIYDNVLTPLLLWPIEVAIRSYQETNPESLVMVTTEGMMSPMVLMLKVSAVAGMIMACPVWLYQIWAFIAPGLYAKEKKNALTFLLSAIPLFLSGVVLGYFLTPKGFTFMLSFTPQGQGITNLQDLNNFLSMELKLLIVFGISFLLPVILVTLNVFGIVKGIQLSKFRNWGIVLCAIFAAVATPSGDPFTMMMLATPMILMYLASEIICRRRDIRRIKKNKGGIDIGEDADGQIRIGEPDID